MWRRHASQLRRSSCADASAPTIVCDWTVPRGASLDTWHVPSIAGSLEGRGYEDTASRELLRSAYDDRVPKRVEKDGQGVTRVEAGIRFRYLGVEAEAMSQAAADTILEHKRKAKVKFMRIAIEKFGKVAVLQARSEMNKNEEESKAFRDRVRTIIMEMMATEYPKMLKKRREKEREEKELASRREREAFVKNFSSATSATPAEDDGFDDDDADEDDEEDDYEDHKEQKTEEDDGDSFWKINNL
eukprot:TRINITY_DN3985_c0_g5_i1.p2 TRINITY_DN3985_c0_g5~~TRINITY_DN3985_c0_g5_i1.p2  ORF type:complete len:244 (+),score=86.57 TRINITY_DN3985_c0_g5_i1:47-778(+)